VPRPIYAVGGYVRDLLLGVSTLDIDLVVEGNAIALARRLGSFLRASVTAHPRFGTARLRLPDGIGIDIAAARAERYPGPAALPEVRPAGLLEDLARRDFSINAMAARVDRHRFGPLVDPFSGLTDLRRGLIRVLHDRSFIDDPTRIFRATRFTARYRFAIARETSRLLTAALQGRAMASLAGSRILVELSLIAKEPAPIRIIRRLSGLGVLAAVHPALAIPPPAFRLLHRIRRLLDRSPSLPMERSPAADATYLLGMLFHLRPGTTRAVLRRLDPPLRLATKIVADLKAGRAAVQRLAGGRDLRPSRIARLIDPLSPEARVLVQATLSGPGARAVSDYLAHSRRIAPGLRGEDLRRLGVRPGPIYRKIFTALRAARLDGRLKSSQEEIAFVRRRFAGKRGAMGKVDTGVEIQ
jgi:tRNA nucleotidyltransferase (CCA-adding enzyme)